MRIATTLIVIYLVLCTAIPANAQPKYSYLYEATNEILKLQRSKMKLTPGEGAGIANSVCKTLETLLRDENFKKDLQVMGKLSEKNSAYHRQLAKDLVFFLNSFVPEETAVLDKAPLSPEAKSQMLAVASALRESLREPKSPEQLWNTIIAFRNEVCKSAETMAKELDNEQSRERRWKTVRRWGMGLAGLSLMGADIVFAAPTGGVAAASISLGGAAVTVAITPED